MFFAKHADNFDSFHGSSKPGKRSFGCFSRPLLEGYLGFQNQYRLIAKSLAVAEVNPLLQGISAFIGKFCLLYQKYKRGLSDELLGKNETTEEWTKVPFGEAFELLQNNTFSRDEMSSESGIAYNIHYGDVLIKYGAVVNLSTSKVPYIRSDVSLSKYAQSSYLRDGDIVIADTAEDYTVGKAVEIVGVADAKALSGLHTIPCRPKISFAPMYLGYFINSKRFRTQILPLVQGTKVSSISKSEILKTSIAFPSFGVQSQIASMLYALDHRIDICQACVQGLVRTKEALLQQLFI